VATVAPPTRNEVTDKGNRDDHRAWCNHRYGDCIHELVVGQPVMFLHNPAVENGTGGETRFEAEPGRSELAPANEVAHG
jgi:hypothetical protein